MPTQSQEQRITLHPSPRTSSAHTMSLMNLALTMACYRYLLFQFKSRPVHAPLLIPSSSPLLSEPESQKDRSIIGSVISHVLQWRDREVRGMPIGK
jgi:hypothetical protein